MSSRCLSGSNLARALLDARADTLSTFACYRRARPSLEVPKLPILNPPLWEIGHIGWFQDWWIGRNPERNLGVDADPCVPRIPSVLGDADLLYDSSRVPHDERWRLALPGVDQTLSMLEQQLDTTLSLLGQQTAECSLYFFRLALFHEDMHHEAAVYMAHSLEIDLDDPRWQPSQTSGERIGLRLEGGRHVMGQRAGHVEGFAFDNELGTREHTLKPYEIDSRVLSWAEYLPFVESGGYTRKQWWDPEGWQWRSRQDVEHPNSVRWRKGNWQQRQGSRWLPLEPSQAACNLSAHEARAWCRWAERRLPSEAEWEHAALSRPGAFTWGAVWEWTSSPFKPFEGFVPHPYREYSQPWFDGRPVLRGASFATQTRMRNVRYRNFFLPERNDVPCGLRTCAI